MDLGSSVDGYLRLAVTVALLYWNTVEGAVFENEYPASFVRLYPVAAWRILLLIVLVAGGMWCPSVGMMSAFFTFFYAMDMEVTMDKWK